MLSLVSAITKSFLPDNRITNWPLLSNWRKKPHWLFEGISYQLVCFCGFWKSTRSNTRRYSLFFFFLINKEVSLVFHWASMIVLFTSLSLDFLLRCFHKWQPLRLSFRALTFLEADIFSDCPIPILHSPIPYSNRGSSKTARLRCVVVKRGWVVR